jgi:hypothetical protein
MEADYFTVCGHLRAMLVNPGIKAPLAAFEPVRHHLADEYLTRGVIDPDRNDLARWLIGDKAYRLYTETKRDDREQNWEDAEAYTRTFYENITRAVLDRDPEATRAVLRALQCDRASPRSGYHVINVFEATLATYFLDPVLIAKIWAETGATVSGGHAAIVCAVPVWSWPSGFEVPANCLGRFVVGPGEVRFRGLMTADQRKALLAALPDTYHPTVETLYARSRTVCRESTL